jgi:hypothetical protein
MEKQKFTIAEKEFTLKFPSYKRCQKVRELLGEDFQQIFDFAKSLEALNEMLDGDTSVLNEDNISYGTVTNVVTGFFTSSREIA